MNRDRHLHLVASRRRGTIRVTSRTFEEPAILALDDTCFRGLVVGWTHVARYGDEEGAIARRAFEGFLEAVVGRRRAPRVLARLLELGLLEERESEGETSVAVIGWRDHRFDDDLRPRDGTGAERQRRRRKRIYGDRYFGVEDDVVYVEPSAEEVAAIEAEGRAILAELDANGSTSNGSPEDSKSTTAVVDSRAHEERADA